MCLTLSHDSAETVNDGHFHTVELVTFNRMVNLSVDGGEPTTLDSQGRSQPGTRDAPLYVGGKISVSGHSGLSVRAAEKKTSITRLTSIFLQVCPKR